jgi:hypothetical protein
MVKPFELQFKYGRVSQINVEQARTSYETAASQIPQIETQIAQTENALSILLGRNPGAIPRGKSIEVLVLPPVPAGLPSQLLERRPDIAQAEQSLIAANAQIGAAKAQYFPTISLTGGFGNLSMDLHDLFSGPARVWSFAGQVTGPIFTGGAIKAQVAQATAVQKAALLNYEATIQSAFADVDNALVLRQKLVDQQAAQERLVKSLKEYERLATLQYNGGYTPYSTVLQAQQSLFPQELSLAQTRSAVYNSLVSLYKATGGGWVDVAEKTATAPPAASKAQTPQAAPDASAMPAAVDSKTLSAGAPTKTASKTEASRQHGEAGMRANPARGPVAAAGLPSGQRAGRCHAASDGLRRGQASGFHAHRGGRSGRVALGGSVALTEFHAWPRGGQETGGLEPPIR